MHWSFKLRNDAHYAERAAVHVRRRAREPPARARSRRWRRRRRATWRTSARCTRTASSASRSGSGIPSALLPTALVDVKMSDTTDIGSLNKTGNGTGPYKVANFVPGQTADARAEHALLRRDAVPQGDRLHPRARHDRRWSRTSSRASSSMVWQVPPVDIPAVKSSSTRVPRARRHLERTRLGGRHDVGAVQRRARAAGALVRDRPQDDGAGGLLRSGDPVVRERGDQPDEPVLQQDAEAVHVQPDEGEAAVRRRRRQARHDVHVLGARRTARRVDHDGADPAAGPEADRPEPRPSSAATSARGCRSSTRPGRATPGTSSPTTSRCRRTRRTRSRRSSTARASATGRTPRSRRSPRRRSATPSVAARSKIYNQMQAIESHAVAGDGDRPPDEHRRVPEGDHRSVGGRAGQRPSGGCARRLERRLRTAPGPGGRCFDTSSSD